MRLFLSIILALAAVGPTHANGWRAGVARIDITPPIGLALWGYAARHDAPSTGTLDPLQARALVLEADGKRIAIVSVDLGRAPTRASMASIRAAANAGAKIDHLFIVASHTHHGPVLEVESLPDDKSSYTKQLTQKLSQVIDTAARTLKPARLSVASKDVALNRNRHSRRNDRPVDRELLVLRVDDTDGHPLAIAVNFAAHPILTDIKSRQWSADFPGAMARLVERETGAVCLFLQGAAGDLSPDPGPDRDPTRFGETLARAVLELSGKARRPDSPPSLRAHEDDFRFPARYDLSNGLVQSALSAAFFRGLVDFYVMEYSKGIRPHLTTALLTDELGIIGVSGEFFCSHALQLKRRSRLEHLLFLGYCNDYQQYFPTIEAVAEGGYGTEPMIAPAEIGAGERVMDRALQRLYELRDKLPTRQVP
jgi:hypothetical protein